jgi:hypothetical protein
VQYQAAMSGTIQNRKTYLQIQLGEIECLFNLPVIP